MYNDYLMYQIYCDYLSSLKKDLEHHKANLNNSHLFDCDEVEFIKDIKKTEKKIAEVSRIMSKNFN